MEIYKAEYTEGINKMKYTEDHIRNDIEKNIFLKIHLVIYIKRQTQRYIHRGKQLEKHIRKKVHRNIQRINSIWI